MSFREIMRELESMGTAQNRTIYGRHGVTAEMYGASYANLGLLKKRIKTDHDLALRFWATGNHDARILATMVIDPARMDSKTLDAWVKEPDSYSSEKLATIEKTIHTSRNRMRDSMNGAVIAIGLRNARLEKQAVAAARRIGTVEVDHGETGCKTPDAVAYIRKAKARKQAKKKR